jgi:uncharacterized OB-fold protein
MEAALEVLPATDNAVSRGFWEAALQNRLVVQACSLCGRAHHPPRPFCETCRKAEMTWRDLSGRGHVWTYAVVHRPVLPAFAKYVPFPVVYVAPVEIPEIRFAGNLVAHPGAPINSVDPARLRIGLPVRVVFDRVADDVALPRWMPEEG